MQIKKIIEYFRDCYKADQRETNIWNIFDGKIEHRLFFKGDEELLTGNLPQQFIDKTYSESVLKTLQIYQKEKNLYYFSFFICGKTGNDALGRSQICAPLLYYPAEIFQGDFEDYFVKIDFSKQQVNYPLISSLDNIENESYEEALFDALPDGEITYEKSKQLIKALEPYLTSVDFTEIYHYPEDLLKEEELKDQFKKNNLKLLPASCLAVMPLSKTTRSVLNELDDMIRSTSFSSPLKKIFSEKPDLYKGPSSPVIVPAILSHAQLKIVELAQTNPLSMVIGPPGTGKSYTIATMALNHFLRDESVLIASRSNTAVDLVADIIEKQLNIKDVVVRGGKSQYLSNLKKYLDNILSGIIDVFTSTKKELNSQLNKTRNEILTIDKEIKFRENKFKSQTNIEKKQAAYIIKNQAPKGFLNKWWVSFKINRIKKRLNKNQASWAIIDDIEKLILARNELLKNYIQLCYQNNLRIALNKNRVELKNFLKAIRSRRLSNQEAFFNSIDFDIILKTFPIWLVNLSDIGEVLPLKGELFDLAIIDEASQCDIASCLPILQRAKRVVIVGDTKQLRHISFLSRLRQNQLIQDNQLQNMDFEKLNYRENSILDLVSESISEQKHIVFLNEHFRSLPKIIQFSNQQFYTNALHIMKQNPVNEQDESVELIFAEGNRKKGGNNENEALIILEKVKKIIEDENLLSNEICHSIGILSPFREQVDYLTKLFSKELTLEEMNKHNLMIGTAHSFQGNERDVMFLSFVVDEKSASGSFTHLNKEDVFNVSITRARVKQYIVLSVKPENLNPQSLFRKYLDYIQNKKEVSEELKPEFKEVSCSFADEVENILSNMGYQCFQAYPVAGIKVDLLVKNGHNKILGIDLVGFPGIFEDAFSLERYKILHRAGLPILPLPYTKWLFQQERCLSAIEIALKKE